MKTSARKTVTSALTDFERLELYAVLEQAIDAKWGVEGEAGHVKGLQNLLRLLQAADRIQLERRA